MKPFRAFAIAAAAVVALTVPAAAPGQDTKADAKLVRGKYLVEEVARCQECHTPVLENGEFDKTQWMKGATMVGIPAKPIPDWHQKAPDISSTSKLWTNWKAEGISKFLQTGKTPKGGKSGPPMPVYKVTAEDADAMTAYLQSLK
jgi:hypothetical protein